MERSSGEGGAAADWHTIGTMALLALSLLFPVVLIYSAVGSYRSINEMKEVFIRSRIVSIKDQIELLPSLAHEDLRRELGNDSDIAEVRIFLDAVSEDPEEARLVQGLLGGKTLHASTTAGVRYRTYMVIHPRSTGPSTAVARIDIYPTAGDRFVRGAWRHLIVAYCAALLSLATLAAYLVVARRSARLRQLAQIGTMSASLAHEIRNPLGAIKGFVQLTRKKSGENVAYYLDATVREVVRLEKLVEDLLAYARTSKPRMRPVPFGGLVAQLLSQGAGSASVEFDYPPDMILNTDPDLLVQILGNLIRNANEACEQGKVRVKVSPRNGEVLIAVDDDGLGIPSQLRKRVFEPFFTTKATGTGLGLPIARKLSEELNGTLRLVPRHPRGTSAQITLTAPSKEEVDGNDSRSG